ncbi:Heme chaperone HemW [Flavobacterium longum]|uniref:radical SAM family heme chaperone HemW n=1 Tax=Flavobacterium longum TaxID=1299340 RepID=UPI0039ED0AFC
MSGIYIHIPFCKQACHYCDFHFSTVMKKRTEMVDALIREIQLRKDELPETIETIYFGGGTPSVLSTDEINHIINAVYYHFTVADNPEITLEANPDDLSNERIAQMAASRINRLSIGIQSFFDEDLKLMNRAHNAAEAKQSLGEAAQYFDNISIDLIYGIPGMDDEKWRQNIETALSFGIPHISSYALTVEPKTTLHKLVATGEIPSPSDEAAAEHFRILYERLDREGFVHYELSNFGKPGYFSRNNTAYWLGKKYLGIGPSAHSYDGNSRSWNVANNSLYLKAIAENRLPIETEILSMTDRYNEYIMTGLRTIWGVSLDRIEQEFGADVIEYLETQSEIFLQQELLVIENRVLKTTAKGKFLSDGLASDLFLVNLEG